MVASATSTQAPNITVLELQTRAGDCDSEPWTTVAKLEMNTAGVIKAGETEGSSYSNDGKSVFYRCWPSRSQFRASRPHRIALQ